MSRAKVYDLLSTDSELLALGLTPDTIYGSQSLDTPLNAGAPFLVQRWGGVPVLNTLVTVQSTRTLPSKRQELAIWVYDKPGDYARIDAIIKRVRTTLASVEALQTDDGWITQIDWTGDGEDLYDDTYEAIMRTSSYYVISSGR